MNVSNNNLFLIKMLYLIRRAMLVCTTHELELIIPVIKGHVESSAVGHSSLISPDFGCILRDG